MESHQRSSLSGVLSGIVAVLVLYGPVHGEITQSEVRVIINAQTGPGIIPGVNEDRAVVVGVYNNTVADLRNGPINVAATQGVVLVNNNLPNANQQIGGLAVVRGVYNFGPTASTVGYIDHDFAVDSEVSVFVEVASRIDGVGFIQFGEAFIRGIVVPEIFIPNGESASFSTTIVAGSYTIGLGSIATGNVTGLSAENQGETTTVFTWGIGALPGTSPDVPIMPTIIDPTSFGFDLITREDFIFIDPDYATGYDYTTEGVPFASVLIPDNLPGGDSMFELLVGGDVYALQAGQEFDFTSIYAGGVQAFSIRGIDLTEQLDPSDPMAFVTGIGFVEGGRVSSLVMSPFVTPVPEPISLALVGVGLAGLLFVRRRKR